MLLHLLEDMHVWVPCVLFFRPHTFEVETVVSIQDGPCVISFDSWVFIIFLMIFRLQLVHDIWGLLGFG
jgi:hypothetical protein